MSSDVRSTDTGLYSSAPLDSAVPELDWDFNASAILGNDFIVGESGLDLGYYFDFAPESTLR
jgi:hypothetical protein